jgi:hypothetical protein
VIQQHIGANPAPNITTKKIITPKKVETSSQKKIKKQAQNLENNVRDITGMKLQYPNPFSTRLEERMPNLFVKSKNEKIDLYSP